MLTLLKNAECYSPRYCGKRDILIAADKIQKILPAGGLRDTALMDAVIECSRLMAFPGLIDQHVHILGGGGEEGFASRLPEIAFSDILRAGVTTLVGLLGADGCTRSLEGLYAKAKGLESQGITAYIYSGSYGVPPVTLTGSMVKDLVLVDKVIGAGEIAISDHRSSQPTLQELLRLAAETHLGGLLSGKAGVVHFHVGDGREGLGLLMQIAQTSGLPMKALVPTHANRNPFLFDMALDYCRFGGHIDLTAGEAAGIPVPQALRRMMDEGTDFAKVTVSSDANGSNPGGGVAKIKALYDDLRDCVVRFGMNPEAVFRLATENVARLLRLYPQKGLLAEGSDADILIVDKNYQVKMLFGRGVLLFSDGGAA